MHIVVQWSTIREDGGIRNLEASTPPLLQHREKSATLGGTACSNVCVGATAASTVLFLPGSASFVADIHLDASAYNCWLIS